MQDRLKEIFVTIMVFVILCMTSCNLNNEQMDLSDVVEIVNEKNSKLDAPSNMPQKYQYVPYKQEAFQPEDFELLTETTQKRRISKQEISQELDWLLRLLRTYYGGFGKFGGDVTFKKAVDDILNEIGEKNDIHYVEYCELLGEHFSFVTDNHFLIGYKTATADNGGLYGNENEKFYKKVQRFYDYSSEAPITSINGEKPEKFLKLAIDKDGKLSYLPYQTVAEDDMDTSLVIKYEDETGREIVLHKTDYVSSRNYDESQRDLYQEMEINGGRKIIYNHFADLESDSSKKFIESAERIKEYPYVIYDISLNSGGFAEVLEKWFQLYTGEELQPNSSQLIRKGFYNIQINEDIKGETEKLKNRMNKFNAYENADYYTWIPQKQFIDTENNALLILLTSSATGSCGEFMTDACRNIKNTIVIGGNTSGSLSGDMSAEFFTLPYSGISFNFGPTVYCWDKEYFQENIGLEPDIYLTGTDSERRFELFLDTYVKEK